MEASIVCSSKELYIFICIRLLFAGEAALNANSDVKVGDYSSRIEEGEPNEEIKSTHEKMPIESVADKVVRIILC